MWSNIISELKFRKPKISFKTTEKNTKLSDFSEKESCGDE